MATADTTKRRELPEPRPDFTRLVLDPLTGTATYHYLRLRLDEELERASRYLRPKPWSLSPWWLSACCSRRDALYRLPHGLSCSPSPGSCMAMHSANPSTARSVLRSTRIFSVSF